MEMVAITTQEIIEFIDLGGFVSIQGDYIMDEVNWDELNREKVLKYLHENCGYENDDILVIK